ncbi:SAM-dependent methyltransferase [Saccharopolyspora taberi]|uniref:SAM-dependent methyltransferase n=1 Tax=Saccharopolyspora taberi TaxID=60895 RepID=A0ABN3VP64_9PSEU
MSLDEQGARPAVPAEVDTSRPNIARIYDAGLGGKDNFEVDRQVMRAILEVAPDAGVAVRDNREWLIRVTRFLAENAGIRQFVDLGSGLPTAENTHEIAQRIAPDSTVVYVDNDPVVEAHSRALLEENEQTHFVRGDLTDPGELLSESVLGRILDLSEPIALYQIGILHHFADIDRLRAIMRTYVDALAPGSYVAISHFHNPGGEYDEIAKRVGKIMLDSGMGGGYFRSREEIASLFAGVELVEPGLTLAPDWWPDGPRTAPLVVPQRMFLVGLARKNG